MLKTKNKNNLQNIFSKMGGYSDVRIRFFLLIFMVFGLVLAPFIGVVGSLAVTLNFAIFAGIKISEFSGTTAVHVFKDDVDLALYHQRKALAAAEDSKVVIEAPQIINLVLNSAQI